MGDLSLVETGSCVYSGSEEAELYIQISDGESSVEVCLSEFEDLIEEMDLIRRRPMTGPEQSVPDSDSVRLLNVGRVQLDSHCVVCGKGHFNSGHSFSMYNGDGDVTIHSRCLDQFERDIEELLYENNSEVVAGIL